MMFIWRIAKAVHAWPGMRRPRSDELCRAHSRTAAGPGQAHGLNRQL